MMTSSNHVSFSGLLVLAGLAAGCSSDTSASDGPEAGSGGSSSIGGSAGTGTGGGSAGTGTGGAGGTSAGSGGATPNMPAGLPSADTKEAVTAFLESARYKESPWISQTPEPRMETSFSQHGSKVRLWMNPSYVDSLRNGRDGGRETGTSVARPYPDQWTMVVKEIFDAEGTTMEGVAVIYRARASADVRSFSYYCWGGSGRCGSGSAPKESPIYGQGQASNQCYFCHSPGTSLFYSQPPAQ